MFLPILIFPAVGGGGTPPTPNYMLLENGDFVLLENGDKIIL